MARTNTLGNFLTDVADAIREKTGSEETIQASEFDTAISEIPSGLDWSAIGYSDTPQGIVDGYNYAKYIQDNWDPEAILYNKFREDRNLKFMPAVDTSRATGMSNMFPQCYSLISVAEMNTSSVINMSNMFTNCYSLTDVSFTDTSKVTNMSSMFANCYSLKTIPLLNTSSVTNMSSMFSGCTSLTDTSLDNILQMCINATSYTGTKTLSALGISNTTYYPTSRIEALPHYQDFINAGWTIGY